MLFFSDQPNLIKIFRVSTDERNKSSKLRVGTFFKNRLEKRIEEKAKLTKSESEEIDQVVQAYTHSKQLRNQYHALNFPEIAREVMDYFETGASDVERRLIAMAVTEALGKIRKHDRQIGGKA